MRDAPAAMVVPAARFSLGLPPLALFATLALALLLPDRALVLGIVDCGGRTVVFMSQFDTTFNASTADIDTSKGLCIFGTSGPDSIVGSSASDLIYGQGGKSAAEGRGMHTCID